MRAMEEVRERVLGDPSPFRDIYPERQRSADPSPLKVKEVLIEDRRYVVCLNEEQRRKYAADREAIVAALRERLPSGGKEFIGNKGFRKFIGSQSAEAFVLDEEKIASEAQFDGKWVLRTNLDDEPEMIALAYKQLWTVEDVFRTMKTVLETRPIYHKRDETIRGHVFCSFLAVMLRRTLELRLEEKGEEWEWAEIVRGLDHMHEVEATFQGKTYFLRSQLIGHAHKAIATAGVALPPTLRQAS